ncbi:MAG: hypothetical protein MHM6MM_001723 [Cercozoa sp. M6MM]
MEKQEYCVYSVETIERHVNRCLDKKSVTRRKKRSFDGFRPRKRQCVIDLSAEADQTESGRPVHPFFKRCGVPSAAFQKNARCDAALDFHLVLHCAPSAERASHSCPHAVRVRRVTVHVRDSGLLWPTRKMKQPETEHSEQERSFLPTSRPHFRVVPCGENNATPTRVREVSKYFGSVAVREADQKRTRVWLHEHIVLCSTDDTDGGHSDSGNHCTCVCMQHGDLNFTDVKTSDAVVLNRHTNDIQRHYRFSPSQLKSMVQKAVRRGQTRSAVRLSLLLMQAVTPQELLRRLPVIIMEDAMLSPFFDAVVWLMLAASTKKFQLRQCHLSHVLTALASTCSNAERDSVPWHASITERSLTGTTLRNPEFKRLMSEHPKAASLVAALMMRASFGGMKGDVLMLRRAALVWMERFLRPREDGKDWMLWLEEKTPTTPVSLESVLPPEARDLLTSGIDFHCSNMAQDLAIQEGVDLETLKSLIWSFRSSCNQRREAFRPVEKTELSDSEKERRRTFAKLARPIELYSRNIIRQRHTPLPREVYMDTAVRQWHNIH